MFISYKYKNPLAFKDNKFQWEYELTDSEFGTVSGIGFDIGTVVSNDIGLAVIQEYSKRNLNVAANLMRAFIWYSKQYPWYSIRLIIDFNKRHNPLFTQYEENLQKYLVLL
jgi:hypothetical protein